uniref:Uncharacterized protein n=1 Tax=Oryza rufipogon TaxID=4529 RepID=A0A0E0PY56_ORYRU
MCKEVGGMVNNGGTRESSNQVALLRPSKCPTARTDQYLTQEPCYEEVPEGSEAYYNDEFF